MLNKMAFMKDIGKTKWEKRDGTKVTFADMDCGHLWNVHKMMGRRKAKAREEEMSCAGYSGGDMAEMYAGHATDDASRRAATIESNMRLLSAYIKVREEFNFLLEGPK